MPDPLLHDALTLLYTAPERYGGVSGVVRNWTDAEIWAEAQAAWREAERSRAGIYPDQWYWADEHTHAANCPADCGRRAVQREWLEEIEALGKIAESQKGAQGRRDATRYNGLAARRDRFQRLGPENCRTDPIDDVPAMK